jgi:hypothetical protein
VITLVEFLAPLRGNPHRDKCLAILYYSERYKDCPGMPVDQVRDALGQARVANAKKINVADVLARSGHYVDAPETDSRGRKLWRLTEQGRRYVRELLSLPSDEPEIEQDVSTLRSLVAGISDPVVQGFVDEGIKCLSVGALRAAVVFLWSGAVRTIQELMLQKGVKTLDVALHKHDPKAVTVKRVEDFAMIKDKLTLLAARELGVIDKGQWTVLDSDLGLRNQCGHPTNYKPGVKKASSLVEDLINNVFSAQL